jgi:hypothetical protein
VRVRNAEHADAAANDLIDQEEQRAYVGFCVVADALHPTELEESVVLRPGQRAMVGIRNMHEVFT